MMEIANGPISKMSMQPVIQQKIYRQNYKIIIIPLSTWETFTYNNIIRLAKSIKAESTLLIYPNGLSKEIGSIIKKSV